MISLPQLIATLIEYLIGMAVVGLIGWVWALWVTVSTLRLHVAEHYVIKPELENIDKKMDLIRIQLVEILSTVHNMKGRLDQSSRGGDIK